MINGNPEHPGVIEILLVEDNPRDAELTQRALDKHRLANNLVWVKDGAEALDLIFSPSRDPTLPLAHPPKLVLLDVKLPKVDGHEVLRCLKQDPRSRMIPVVMMTSSNEETDIERAYDGGANSYIVKPVDFEKFVEAIGHVGLYWLLINQPPLSSRASRP